MKHRKPVLVASHPRSGTHLMLDTLRQCFAEFNGWKLWWEPLDYLYLNIERLASPDRRFDDQLAQRILNRSTRALLKTHFLPDFRSSWDPRESEALNETWLDYLDGCQVIYVVRNPLDVMASYKQFLSPSDPSIVRSTLGEFILSSHWDRSCDRLGWWARHVDLWKSKKDVHVVRYEDLVGNTKYELERLSRVLELELPERDNYLPTKLTNLFQSRVGRFASLRPSSTAIVADRSRFPLEDWRTTLREADFTYIEATHSLLLRSLGYSLAAIDD